MKVANKAHNDDGVGAATCCVMNDNLALFSLD